MWYYSIACIIGLNRVFRGTIWYSIVAYGGTHYPYDNRIAKSIKPPRTVAGMFSSPTSPTQCSPCKGPPRHRGIGGYRSTLQ